MKKTIFLLCMAALVGKAQPYGEKLYQHAGSFCSSGALTSVNTPGINGFVTSGIVPLAAAGTPNYFIDKTGPGGIFGPAAAFPFSKAYAIRGDRQCSAAPPQAQQMRGVDVIEATASAINGWYAKAGVFEHGVFFSMLNAAGNPVSTGYYPFPSNAQNPSRPVIVASPIATEYFVCGSYFIGNLTIMYVINLRETGFLAAGGSWTYSLPGTSLSLTPQDMVVSPYANELVVVGHMANIPGSPGSNRGFLMRLNINTLGIIYTALFGQPLSVTSTDGFSCITVANSFSNGGNGFAIGGTTSSGGTANGMIWTLKVDPTGTIIYWNTITRPITDPNARNMIAIKERFSAFYGAYEYYGAVVANNGMMVLKLDDNGLPFTSLNPVDNFNEFVYFGALAAPSRVRDLTYINNGSPSDVGIHVYGTDDGATGGYHHFVEATFNGVSDAGCTNSAIYTGATSVPGPGTTPINVTAQPGLVKCASFNMGVKVQQTVPKVLCNAPVFPAGGSNNKSAVATGIESQQGISSRFSVSPNPVSNRVEIKFNASQSDVVDLKLYDYLGRFVHEIPVLSMDAGNAQTAALDLSTLSVESGIYIIHATINGVSSQQKIIYTKGQ